MRERARSGTPLLPMRKARHWRRRGTKGSPEPGFIPKSNIRLDMDADDDVFLHELTRSVAPSLRRHHVVPPEPRRWTHNSPPNIPCVGQSSCPPSPLIGSTFYGRPAYIEYVLRDMELASGLTRLMLLLSSVAYSILPQNESDYPARCILTAAIHVPQAKNSS